MWGNPPFYISENCAVDVRNLAPAREWYKEKLGLREANTDGKRTPGGQSSTCTFLTTTYFSHWWNWGRAWMPLPLLEN